MPTFHLKKHFDVIPLLGAVLLLLTWSVGCRRTTPSAPAASTPHLPIITIATEDSLDWDDYVSGSFVYHNMGDSSELKGKVKFRGGFSSRYPKHSYALKLKEKFSLCGLPANKNWVLNASYIDKTFMRHKLCYDLFRMMGDYNLAPQCAYALVHENGSPQGLYVVMQRLNKKVLGLDEKDSEAFIFKEPKVFFADNVMPPRSEAEPNFHGQNYPDFEKQGDQSAIVDDFHRFITSSSDEKFSSEIGEWIDIRNVLDWHLLILFTNGGDGVLKNFYLYKQNVQTPFRVALWDCDHSFGRDGDNELNMLEHLPDDHRNILFNRLMQMDWYQEMMLKRWWQLRNSGVFSYQNIEKMMKENDRFIQMGIAENCKLWSFQSEFYFDGNDYEQEKAIILQFVTLSLQHLDEMFQ